MIVRSRWRQYVCNAIRWPTLALHPQAIHGELMDAYKTVRDHVVLLQHRRSHLSVLVVVMLDEVGIAHSGLLSHEDGGFDDFAEACCRGIAGFEDHSG